MHAPHIPHNQDDIILPLNTFTCTHYSPSVGSFDNHHTLPTNHHHLIGVCPSTVHAIRGSPRTMRSLIPTTEVDQMSCRRMHMLSSHSPSTDEMRSPRLWWSSAKVSAMCPEQAAYLPNTTATHETWTETGQQHGERKRDRVSCV